MGWGLLPCCRSSQSASSSSRCSSAHASTKRCCFLDKLPRNRFERIDSVNGNILLIVRVEVRHVVRRASLREHANDDSEKTAQLRHGQILHYPNKTPIDRKAADLKNKPGLHGLGMHQRSTHGHRTTNVGGAGGDRRHGSSRRRRGRGNNPTAHKGIAKDGGGVRSYPTGAGEIDRPRNRSG